MFASVEAERQPPHSISTEHANSIVMADTAHCRPERIRSRDIRDTTTISVILQDVREAADKSVYGSLEPSAGEVQSEGSNSALAGHQRQTTLVLGSVVRTVQLVPSAVLFGRQNVGGMHRAAKRVTAALFNQPCGWRRVKPPTRAFKDTAEFTNLYPQDASLNSHSACRRVAGTRSW